MYRWEKDAVRTAYVNNRDLTLYLFDENRVDSLTNYFSVKDNKKLKKHLSRIIETIIEIKSNSFLNTVKKVENEIIFHNNFIDYTSGNAKAKLTFIFSVSGGKIEKYFFTCNGISIEVKE